VDRHFPVLHFQATQVDINHFAAAQTHDTHSTLKNEYRRKAHIRI